MSMGSAYAGGGGLVQKQDSYVPLLRSSIERSRLASESGIADREMALKERMYAERDTGGAASRTASRGGGRSSADTEAERRRQKLAEQRQEQERQDAWSRKNQYMAAHHGREPTPEELAEMQYEQESKEGGLIREEKGRQFDESLALQRSESALEREARSTEKGTGLKEREDVRRGEKHRREMTAADMEISKEARTQEHSDMMKAFVINDYASVEQWFKDNAAEGKSGGLDNPMMEATDDPDMVRVKWPGKDEPQTVSKDALGELLSTLNPKFEQPKSEKDLRKGKKPMSKKDAAKAAADYASGVTRNNRDYAEAYGKEYRRLTGEGEKKLVQEFKSKTGKAKFVYSDGSWETKDKDGIVIDSSD